MNANWIVGGEREHGRFELMIITADDEHHVLAASPTAMSALVAPAQPDTSPIGSLRKRHSAQSVVTGALSRMELASGDFPSRTVALGCEWRRREGCWPGVVVAR
jgi:hypothetical protein